MKVAFVIYPDFTALDLVGPYEVISRWRGAEVHFVSSSTDPVRCDSGACGGELWARDDAGAAPARPWRGPRWSCVGFDSVTARCGQWS